MHDKGRGILGRRDATPEEIRQALEYAVYDAWREHKRAGVPIAVWDREAKKVVLIPPEEIVVPDEEEHDAGEPRDGSQP